MKLHFEYSLAGFRSCVMDDGAIELAPSSTWSDDAWFADQDARRLEESSGWWVLQEGEAEGTTVGGNLCTFNLLQGTPYMPSLEGAVVFVEDDDQVRPWDFDRDLVSLLQQPGFSGVRGLVVGRFQRATGMTRDLLAQIVPDPVVLPQLLTMDELAERLGVTHRHVRRLVAERRVPFLRVGRLVRFDPAKIAAWLDSRRVPEAPI
jgi:excisionase family DNA binding protein